MDNTRHTYCGICYLLVTECKCDGIRIMTRTTHEYANTMRAIINNPKPKMENNMLIDIEAIRLKNGKCLVLDHNTIHTARIIGYDAGGHYPLTVLVDIMHDGVETPWAFDKAGQCANRIGWQLMPMYSAIEKLLINEKQRDELR